VPTGPTVEETEVTTTVSTGATTRRHKHTPSTGSFVTTITESNEEEDASVAASGTGMTKEGEGEKDDTPVEEKPKVDEKTDEVVTTSGGEAALEKGVAEMDIEKAVSEAEGVDSANSEKRKDGDESVGEKSVAETAQEPASAEDSSADKDGADHFSVA
jgi:hypothetical protein